LLAERGEAVGYLGVEAGARGLAALAGHLASRGYVCEPLEPLVGDEPGTFVRARAQLGTDLELVAPGGDPLPIRLARARPDRVIPA
jgi:hypothetical protein